LLIVGNPTTLLTGIFFTIIEVGLRAKDFSDGSKCPSC